MNSKTFKANAERIFQKANPGAVASEWTWGPQEVKWADGSSGYSGRFKAEGFGWRGREMSATSHEGDTWVR